MSYSKLSKEELTRRLQTSTENLEELEELEEERSFVLKQTGIHLPGHVVKKFASDSAALSQLICDLKEELVKRN